MNQQNDLFKEAIKSYLDHRAEKDAQFALRYGLSNKNLDECCKYIINEVRKTGREGFADEEIFGLAVHYYDEDNIGELKDAKCSVVVNRKIELSEKRKQELQEEAENEYRQQILRNIREREDAAKKKEEEKRRLAAEKASIGMQSLF